MESLFGRYEAAALLAIERANGGELAPLEQVLVAFEGLFGAGVTAATFAESVALLVDAGLVAYADGALELTVDGRRTIRRSGAHFDPDFPAKVADRLALIDEDELAPEGELPSPSEEDVLAALASLGKARIEHRAPVTGDLIAPSGMAGHHTLASRMLSGLPGGFGVRIDVPGVSSSSAGRGAAPGPPRTGSASVAPPGEAGAGSPPPPGVPLVSPAEEPEGRDAD